MASTSPDELARALLENCLDGRPVQAADLEALVAHATHADPARALQGSRALFSILVEGLADRFEPALADAYADLFSHALELALPDLRAGELRARFERIRKPRPFRDPPDSVHDVIVLSRVTLGADVAVTSVILDAVKRRFPRASIHFAAPRKAWELFAADDRVRHLPIDYGRRGTLSERLSAWASLKAALDRPGGIVVDPDSRLTQLGLLPVCPEEAYYFFESRSYGAETGDSLSRLTRRWAAEVFQVENAAPYLAPAECHGRAGVAVSLGVGENPAKRVADPFEQELLAELAQRGLPILIDRGAGGEEAQRVERALAACGAVHGQVETWDGAFAPFAARIARSRLYVGYDSAGQHVAAACGVPLVTVFAGYACRRMFQRWRPDGPGPVKVIDAQGMAPDAALHAARSAFDRLRTG